MDVHRAAAVTGERYHHAEGPIWDSRTGRLLWVDQYAGQVHAGTWDGQHLAAARSYDLGAPVGAVAPERRGDGWVVAAGRGFVRLAPDGTVTELAPVPVAFAYRMRMNDGGCDPGGRFWAGTIAFDKTPGVACLYRLEPDGTVTTVLDGVTISNGIAWVDGGATMYYIDTPTSRVDRFHVTADGRLTDRRPLVRVEGGFPDGMTLDDEGCLWVAVWGAGAVHRYAPGGKLLAVVEVDAPQVSSCAFGGDDGRTLFITTSQEGYSPAESAAHSDAGRIFVAEVGVGGPPAAPFGAP